MNQAARKRRLTRLEKRLELVGDAIDAIVGGAQSYNLGTRSVTKADLGELVSLEDDIQDEIDALEAGGDGHRQFKRVVPRF